jgi:hypothetical protein
MANQHHPAESGRRPVPEITAGLPDCHQCSWVWRADPSKRRLGEFVLKYLSSACGIHRLVPDDQGADTPLVTWLGLTA